MKNRSALAAALLAFLVALTGLVVLVSDDDSDTGRDTVTVRVDSADPGRAPDNTITVPEEAVDQAEEALTGETATDSPATTEQSADHTDSRGESPTGVPADQLEANELAQDANRETTTPLPTGGATTGFSGCRTAFVSNQSSRNGVRPTVQVLHYTVSPNRPGRSDVDGITAFFNRSSSQASSNFVIDAEGNCNYIVPIERKAWTQAGGNPWAISYEIIATGRESAYLQAAGYAKLRQVAREVARRTGIPLRRGRISGCSPSTSGIVQHADGGSCWGGHHDIGPFNFADVVAKVTAGGATSRTADLRSRNRATHKRLRDLGCAPRGRTKRQVCIVLHRRHAAIHAAAKRERIKL